MATMKVDLEGGEPITRLPVNVANQLRRNFEATLRRGDEIAKSENTSWRFIDRAKGRERKEIEKDLGFYG